MEVNRLRADELLYELAIRGQPTNGTVAENRIKLRAVLGSDIPEIELSTIECNNEIQICAVKLTDLQGDVEEFDVKNKQNEFSRISSRLIHLRDRLDRIKGGNDTLNRDIVVLRERCHSLMEALNRRFSAVTFNDRPVQVSLLDEPIERLEEILRNSEIADEVRDRNPERSNVQPATTLVTDVHQSTGLENRVRQNRVEHPAHSSALLSSPVHRPLRQTADETACFVPTISSTAYVHKWNLKFDGRSSLTDFLERADELRQSRGVTKLQLWRSATELFSGDALIWYRSTRHTLNSWDELVQKLKCAFLPTDYELMLLDEIRERTQGSEERVTMYISVMENLFNRLEKKPSEKTRVDMIKRNLLPAYQHALALTDVNGVEQLTRLCRSVEDTNDRSQKFKPPPSNQTRLLEPHLAYRRPKPPINVHEMTVTNAASPRVMSECWNCGERGHLSRNCPQPARRHCYRCGAVGVTVRTCHTCSGNARPRV